MRRALTNMMSSVVIIDDNDTRSCKVASSCLRRMGIVCEDIVVEGWGWGKVKEASRIMTVLDRHSPKMETVNEDRTYGDIDDRWEWK